MKKFLLGALAIAAMASCSKNESSDANPNNPNAIRFGNYNDKLSRAVALDGTSIKDQGFYVYANESAGAFGSAISKDHVTWSVDKSDWVSGSTYYWNGRTLDFYAYSTKQTLTADANGVIVPLIAANAKAQEDILVAAPVTGATSGKVNFTFNHALSKVDFKIACGAGVTVSIKSFQIQGVNTASTGLNIKDGTFAGLTGAALTSAYTYGAAAAFAAPVSIAANADKTLSAVDADGAFMLLPQTLTAYVPAPAPATPGAVVGARMVINYTLSINGTELFTDKEAFFPMPGTWVKGNSYLYTLTFTQDGGGGYDPGTDLPLVDTNNQIKFGVTEVTGWTADPGVTVPNN